MRKGNSPNSRNGWDTGVWVPGAFKLDHLQPVKPILFPKFFNFYIFILDANSYYPKGLIMRKGYSLNSKNGWDTGVCVPGAFKLDLLQLVKPILFPKFFNSYTFILEANSYYPRGLIMRKGISPNSKIGVTEGFECLCCSNWTICSLASWFCLNILSPFWLHGGPSNSFYPRRSEKWKWGKRIPSQLDETQEFHTFNN